MPRWCNHCSAELDSLDYRAEVTEWGRCDVDGGDWESHDSENTGDTTYSCPECERETCPEDLLDEDPDEEEEEEEEEETISPPEETERSAENRATVKMSFDEKVFSSRRTSGNVNVITCTGCRHSFSIQTRDDAVCPKCETENYTNEVITI